jgi:hypothetical protein
MTTHCLDPDQLKRLLAAFDVLIDLAPYIAAATWSWIRINELGITPEPLISLVRR